MINPRSIRIYNIAVVDVVLSLVVLIYMFLYIHKKYYSNLDKNNFIIAGILLMFPLAIFFHIIFAVNTNLNFYLGLSNKPSS